MWVEYLKGYLCLMQNSKFLKQAIIWNIATLKNSDTEMKRFAHSGRSKLQMSGDLTDLRKSKIFLTLIFVKV